MAEDLKVPQISETQAAGSSPALDQVLSQSISVLNNPLPPAYTGGTDIAQPKVKPVRPYTPQSTNNQPITNQATSIKEARQKNSFAAIANIIGMAGQALQQRKQDDLKSKLTDVMRAKQNIANAQAVLEQDPNNELAKSVLAKNKQQLNDIVSDPKHQKQLAKALDISFTDMDKNKTPEVQAYMQAKKEFDSSGPYKYDNPGEAKLAAYAEGGGGDNKQQPQAAPQARSATPYADRVLSKDMSTIQPNPQYQAALEQRQQSMKMLMQYWVPKEIEKQIQEARDGNANARANIKAATTLQQQYMKDQDQLKITDAETKRALELQKLRNSSMYARTKLTTDTMLKVADKRSDDVHFAKAMKDQAVENIDKQIAQLSKTIITREQTISVLSQTKAGVDEKTKYEQINDKAALEALQAMRNGALGIPISPDGAFDSLGIGSLMESTGNENNVTDKHTELELVGASESDDTDSDKY